MGTTAGKSIPEYIRRAEKAHSWYEGDPHKLDRTLTEYLTQAKPNLPEIFLSRQNLRAIISPHAGYSYSGPTAGYSYQALLDELEKNSKVRTILVLHPSHHVYIQGCAISNATGLETPLGTIPVDTHLRHEILQLSNQFTLMEQDVDEAEHSGEMQYPFLQKILLRTQRNDIKVLPIMCGALSTQAETEFGRLLSEIIARDSVITVVSTDFCHWGKRFSYQPVDAQKGIPIHQYIQQLDRQAMDLIEMKEPGAFAKYLKETKNTICGRHAIAVWLRALEAKSDDNLKVKHLHYDQSSAVKSMNESSVSYVATASYV